VLVFMKKVTDLNQQEIDKAITDLIQFYKFSFFDERNVDVQTGLIFALEQQVCSMGLVGEWLYSSEHNSADLLTNFVEALDARAMSTKKSEWQAFRAYLPYGNYLDK